MEDSQEFETLAGPVAPASLPASQAASRGNALRHGLTATTLLEELFGAESYAQLTAALRDELGSWGPLLEALVGRAAHHLAALELSRLAELAALREGARKAVAFNAGEAGLAANPADVELSLAVSSEILDRVTSYARGHERGLLSVIARLQELKVSCALQTRRPTVGPIARDRDASGARDTTAPPSKPEVLDADLFAEDADCEAYLLRRMRSADYRCPGCGASRGYWLKQRRRWECHQCRKQSGPRTGTVMAGSPLRLSIWFKAIRIVVARADVNIAEAAPQLRIGRMSTIRAMLHKIHSALSSPHCGRLLADLDRVFASVEPELAVPETSASPESFLKNEN